MELILIGLAVGAIWLFIRWRQATAEPSLGRSTPIPGQAPTTRRDVPSQEGARPPIHPKAPQSVGKARWWLPGETFEAQGFRISGGLVYVGNSLQRVGGAGTEPALINPRLPILPKGTADDMPYWPSYTEISPAARGAYLRWLAEGRSDPNANIGLVFLFFYGLERRALFEKAQTIGSECEEIRLELRRLLGIYGDHSSFRRYATEFLGVLQTTALSAETLVATPPTIARGYECVNLHLKVGLGWMVNQGRAIPANWALAWVRSNDGFYERTPSTRCPAEFERLFGIRYAAHFGEGIVVKPNKTPVKASYRPASASFADNIDLSMLGLPDITVLKQPIEKLVSLANQCTDDLDSYSRYLGRNPGGADTAAALTLLPTALIQRTGHSALERIVGWIDGLVFLDDLAVTTYGKLREAWESLPSQNLSKRDCVMIAQCLGKLGFGVEPDIRFGSHQMDPSDSLVLFPLPEDSPTAPSPAYTSATLVTHLGALMAHADNQVTDEEEQALMAHVTQSLELNAAERLRLRAYLKWLLLTPPEMSGLKRRIEALPPDRKSTLGVFLARLVGLDGDIAPAEITALQKIYRQLGLDPNNVFADTHLAATEPVAARAAESAPGFSIPTPVPAIGAGKVNLQRIRAMELESERVSVLLREIFVSEEEIRPASEPAPDRSISVTVRILDLDEAHSQFALSLLERASWARAELEELASNNRLLPDGAVDAVNEATLNLHGESLLDGDDPITVNQELRSALQP